LPKAKVLEQSAKVPGTNGEKMSKSYDNTIEIFEPPKQLRKKVMRITTDSRPVEDPKEPADDHLFQLYSLFVDDERKEKMAAKYRAGGFGYGEVKGALAEVADEYFAAARARRLELETHPKKVEEILANGASRARKKAGEVLRRAQKACGISR
jgi:tryptophanyl-tRNA synthetase